MDKTAIKEALAEILGDAVGLKHDATGTPNAQYFHGTGGILTMPGLDPKVYSTLVGVEPGILGRMMKIPSVYDNPYYETITGVQADIGSEPSTPCATCKQPGLTKGCTLDTAFGRICRETREVNLERVGQRVNSSDPMDLMLMNLLPNEHMTPAGMPPSKNLNSELVKLLLEFGTSISRELSQMVYNGNVANAVGTGYVPFNGFDQLITTGQVDTVSGTSCPSLDSDIKDFNYQLITTTNPADIVEVLSAMANFLQRLADTTGMPPIQWVLTMTPSLFYELSQLWPCRYSTFGCNVTNTTTGNVNVDGVAMVRERDRLRAQRVLPINGIEFPVITDQGITEETNGDNANINPGEAASDIYMIPMTAGGVPVTFMEYYQFSNPANLEMQAWMGDQGISITDNGMWQWTTARTYACIKKQGVIRPRLILRTPQLAGRIQNVRYNPLQHERTPYPGDDTYYVNGGDTSESNWPI